MSMIGWDEFIDWITGGIMILLSLVAVFVLLIVVCHVIDYAIRRKTPALSIEDVLQRIPDAPYQELPGGDAGGDDDGERCVICVAPYEPAGQARGVLPGCGHVFHKLCVAKWLRRNSTCPLCRAAFAVTTTDDTRQDNVVNVAENVV